MGAVPVDNTVADVGAPLRRGPSPYLYRRALDLADRLDAEAVSGSFSPRLVPGLWAGLKLALVGLASPLLGPWVGTVSSRNHRRVKRLIDRFPDVIEAVMAGDRPDFPVARVGRIPSGERWFISSDLHRSVPGRLDFPGRQNTTGLYDAALGCYADAGWGLVENGDVEEYWLVGGSAYGVVYDLGRMVAALWPGAAGRAFRRTVYAEHLRRIVANNQPTFDLIQRRFHQGDRYRRLAGNHDDCYEDPSMVEVLRQVHPGLDVVDFVVLDGDHGPVGVVAHGHQTDAWNGPVFPNTIARFTSSLGSAIHDFPLAGGEPGLSPPEDTDALLESRVLNRLSRVNGLTGATMGLDSLDEVLLFESFHRCWGREGGDLEGGPFVVLGHTHLPVTSPADPGSGARWRRYRNAGSTLTHELVTGVEWDGSRSASRPEVRLVGWGYGRPDTATEVIAGSDRGRPIVRWVLEADSAGPTIRVRPDRLG